jgi:hypothetical protein
MKKLSLKLALCSLMVIANLFTGNARAISLSFPGNREAPNQTQTTHIESNGAIVIEKKLYCSGFGTNSAKRRTKSAFRKIMSNFVRSIIGM